MKSLAIFLTLICGVAVAQDSDRLQRLRELQDDAPKAIAESADEQILLNEAAAILEEEERLTDRQSQFPGDIDRLKAWLTMGRELLKQTQPSPLQARAASITQRERDIREERNAMLSEIQGVLSALSGGCETCGPDCPCGADCDCINGECVPRRRGVDAASTQVASVCQTTGKPYVHDGCRCPFCLARQRPAVQAGTSVRVQAGGTRVVYEVVPGSCASGNCQYRAVVR
ncbi:hypothetical protein [Kordiimonas sp.]|uniref:hypothetical protein n=1 Tax=Kordiimonas sp. TaxID=1970157 RepID=UPI003A911B5C